MTALAIAVIVALGLLIAVRPWAWRATVVRQRAVVNTKGGSGFNGVVWARRGPMLVLKDVVRHDGNNAVPLDGEVIVLISDIDFIQVVR